MKLFAWIYHFLEEMSKNKFFFSFYSLSLINFLLFTVSYRLWNIMCLYILSQNTWMSQNNIIVITSCHSWPFLTEKRALEVSTAACGSRRWHALDWFAVFIKYQCCVCKNMHTCVAPTAWCLYVRVCVMTSYLAVVFRAPRWWLQGMFRDAGDYLHLFAPFSLSLSLFLFLSADRGDFLWADVSRVFDSQ